MPPALVLQVLGRLGGYQVGVFIGASFSGVGVCLHPGQKAQGRKADFDLGVVGETTIYMHTFVVKLVTSYDNEYNR